MKYPDGSKQLCTPTKKNTHLTFQTLRIGVKFIKLSKKELDFPDYYGENWDALWDCLTEMVDEDEPLNIEILGAEVLEQKFPEDLKMLVEIFKELKHWEDDYFFDCVKIEIIYGEARYEIS